MFRFTIRDLFWITLFVAMGLVLWHKRRESARIRWQRDTLVSHMERGGYRIVDVSGDYVWVYSQGSHDKRYWKDRRD
jgi:hypothetical protein